MKTLEENYLESELSAQPLASKAIILICCLLTSPLTAAIIYASNLYRTNQAGRIVGTLILICLAEFFVQMPFMGFECDFPYPILNLFLKGVTGVFMISWLWSRHFPKESVQRFELRWLVIVFVIYCLIHFLLNILLQCIVSSSLLPNNSYISYHGRFEIIVLVITIKFMCQVVKRFFKK